MFRFDFFLNNRPDLIIGRMSGEALCTHANILIYKEVHECSFVRICSRINTLIWSNVTDQIFPACRNSSIATRFIYNSKIVILTRIAFYLSIIKYKITNAKNSYYYPVFVISNITLKYFCIIFIYFNYFLFLIFY